MPTRRTAPVTIRAYRPTDHRECRQLWAELTEEHRARYGEARSGGDAAGDPGAGFEEYLTRLDLSGMWVADDQGAGVVGFVGLVLDGRADSRAGEVEPVVVTASRRGEGIGRALLSYVAEQGRRRGLRQLTISPASRNVDAIRCLHAAGYDELARVTLAIDLGHEGRRRSGGAEAEGAESDAGIELYDVRFRH